jgi:histidinol-phosphate aminotransferase
LSSVVRPALQAIVPYEPGKPVEEVQRELGLERVVKLASNEGPFGPFPAALEAMERSLLDLNRYPDSGGYALREALAARHGVASELVALGSGGDGVIDCLAQATLDAIGPRTKLAYLCLPNNPTGTTNTRAELDGWFERVPEHVLTVVDQAYFEYIDEPDYPDAIEEYVKAGRQTIVIRTFSKIYGLAGLRIGYGVGPAELVSALGKVRRAFDFNSQAQAAAFASLGDEEELGRRRRVNAEGRDILRGILESHGWPTAQPAVANFLFAEVGDDARPVFEALLRQGVIVRPCGAFGAPGAIRVTVGTPDEHEFLAGALARIGAVPAPA